MNDPRSSNGQGGAAKQATMTVSDLGLQDDRVERPRRSHVKGGASTKTYELRLDHLLVV